MNKKIVLICGRTFTVVKFRKNLIEELHRNNYDVFLIAFDNNYEREIRDWNVNFFYVNQDNRSINVFDKIKLTKDIANIIKHIKPDKVFTFMTTPNIFGNFASNICGIEHVYSMVEGLGDVFTYNNIKWKILRALTSFLYKLAFRKTTKVVFLNNDDKNEFINRKLVSKEKTAIIPGIGVDTDYFSYCEPSNKNVFLMAARMMPAKGIIEYCEAASIVKTKYPNVMFKYVGEEFTLKYKDIEKYVDSGIIEYLGYVEDIRFLYEECLCYISPSYREGLPMVLLEAGSSGRASIVSNCVGNRDIIINGYNGIIVENNKPINLANAIEYAINNKEEIISMGKNARTNIENKYNKEIICKLIMEILNN